MLIDWFTVVAQAINFLVLVWLLKHFLYKPILDAIDSREQLIAETIAEAVETKDAAQTQRDELERKNQQFSHDRDALVSQMKQEVNAQRHKLLDEAQTTAEAIRAKRLEALQREQKAFADELARQTQEQIFSIARKVLRELANTSLEEQITTVFTRQLHDMNGQAKQALAEALTKSSEPVRVRTAFELSEEQQTTIQDAINQTFAADVLVRFEVAPDGIGGIELTASGRKVSWSIDGYLTLLRKSLLELTGPEAETLERETEVVCESVS